MKLDQFEGLIEDVAALQKWNAKHRKGYRVGQVAIGRITKHLLEEAQELHEAPDDHLEAGDVLSILLQVILRNGWDVNVVAYSARKKLRKRFECGGHLKIV